MNRPNLTFGDHFDKPDSKGGNMRRSAVVLVLGMFTAADLTGPLEGQHTACFAPNAERANRILRNPLLTFSTAKLHID